MPDQMSPAPRGSSSGLAVEYAEDFAAWEAQWKLRLLRRLMGAIRRSTYRAFIAYGAIWVPESLAYSSSCSSSCAASAGAGLTQPAEGTPVQHRPGRDS
jgi:hypothetical protein